MVISLLLCQPKIVYQTKTIAMSHGSSINMFWFMIAMLAFAIVFGIRYDVGVDHLAYVNMYIWGVDYSPHEFLYQFYSNVCEVLDMPYPLFFAIISFLQVTLFFSAFKNESYLFPFLVLFLFFDGLYDNWNNIIRASIAFCIWVYSLKYIDDKKIVPYLICNVIAVGFHYSSAILVVVYPLLVKGNLLFKNVSLQLALIGLAFILRHFFGHLSGPLSSLIEKLTAIIGLYEGYTPDRLINGSVRTTSGTNIAFYVFIMVNISIVLVSPKLLAFYNNRKFRIVYNLFFIGIFLSYSFPDELIALTRPFRYFTLMHPIMLSYMAYYLYKNKKTISFFVMLFLYIGIFYFSISVKDRHSHFLYQTYINHKETPITPKYKPVSVFKY